MPTHVAFGVITNTNDLPTLIGVTVHNGQSMAESGASAASAGAAMDTPGYSSGRLVCRIKVSQNGAAIYAAVGPSPVATAANGIRLDPGDVEYIKCTLGDKVAIITA